MLFQRGQSHVRIDRLVARIGFTDEQVGVASDVDDGVGPLRVAGIGDGLAFDLAAIAQTRTGALVVHNANRRHLHAGNLVALADLDFVQCQREDELQVRRAGIGALHHFGVTRFEAGRSGNGQRAFALEHIIGFKNEERHTADMVGVKMGDENGGNGIAVDRQLVHADQRGGAAVDQCIDVLADEMKAGVEPPAGAECVAAADNLQVHRNPRRLTAP
jgi:hypothetical protein